MSGKASGAGKKRGGRKAKALSTDQSAADNAISTDAPDADSMDVDPMQHNLDPNQFVIVPQTQNNNDNNDTGNNISADVDDGLFNNTTSSDVAHEDSEYADGFHRNVPNTGSDAVVDDDDDDEYTNGFHHNIPNTDSGATVGDDMHVDQQQQQQEVIPDNEQDVMHYSDNNNVYHKQKSKKTTPITSSKVVKRRNTNIIDETLLNNGEDEFGVSVNTSNSVSTNPTRSISNIIPDISHQKSLKNEPPNKSHLIMMGRDVSSSNNNTHSINNNNYKPESNSTSFKKTRASSSSSTSILSSITQKRGVKELRVTNVFNKTKGVSGARNSSKEQDEPQFVFARGATLGDFCNIKSPAEDLTVFYCLDYITGTPSQPCVVVVCMDNMRAMEMVRENVRLNGRLDILATELDPMPINLRAPQAIILNMQDPSVTYAMGISAVDFHSENYKLTNDMKVYLCTDHDALYGSPPCAIICALDEEHAVSLLDDMLVQKGLKPYRLHKYRLSILDTTRESIIELCNGDNI